MAAADPKAWIRDQALRLGFDCVGFAPAVVSAAAKQALADFLAKGYHGDMGWLADKATRRADPKSLWPAANSVIVLGLNYGPRRNPLAALAQQDRGNISVYAQGRDYHDLLKKKLKALARQLVERHDTDVKVFVDTAPVLEKHLAEAAGLGWQGKHSNLVSRDFGSWLFLGEIFTTMRLEADAPGQDHCGACQRCLDACPTDAFTGPYKLDARRCISYLTIEHKGHIPRVFRAAMGNRIYGCDDCLAVCPWNKFAQPSAESGFLPRAELSAPKLAALAALDDQAFRQVFAGSPIKRSGRDRFLRNVLIALGNSGQASAPPEVWALLQDASPLVRAMAIWALRRLESPENLVATRSQQLAGEEDPEVRQEWDGSLEG